MLAAILNVEHLVEVAGYPLLFLMVMAETSGLPIPGETALITAAVLAGQGKLEIGIVIALAAAAAIVGDNIGYLIGRKGGRWVLERPGAFQGQRQEVLRVGEPFFEVHGAKAVFFGRFILGLRVWASWLAGATRMPWHTFVALERARRHLLGDHDRVARLLPRARRRQRRADVRHLRPRRRRVRDRQRVGLPPPRAQTAGAGAVLSAGPRCTVWRGPTALRTSRRSAAAGSDPLPHVRHQHELGLGEMREEVLADDEQMGAPRFLEADAARRRETGVGPARVVRAGAALEQLLALEPVDEPREPAARELGALGEFAHPHAPVARIVEVMQDLV